MKSIKLDTAEEFGVGFHTFCDDIVFCCEDVEVMKLTSEGMIYMGEAVEDAGEAHKLFKDTMQKMGRSV